MMHGRGRFYPESDAPIIRVRRANGSYRMEGLPCFTTSYAADVSPTAPVFSSSSTGRGAWRATGPRAHPLPKNI